MSIVLTIIGIIVAAAIIEKFGGHHLNEVVEWTLAICITAMLVAWLFIVVGWIWGLVILTTGGAILNLIDYIKERKEKVK